MDSIKQFLKNETERLKRIEFHKLYYLDSSIQIVCITFNGFDYIKERMDVYSFFLLDGIHELNVDIGASIITVIEFE